MIHHSSIKNVGFIKDFEDGSSQKIGPRPALSRMDGCGARARPEGGDGYNGDNRRSNAQKPFWILLVGGSLGWFFGIHFNWKKMLFLCTNYGSPAGARRHKACASTQMVRSSHPDDNWAYVWIPYICWCKIDKYPMEESEDLFGYWFGFLGGIDSRYFKMSLIFIVS